ncbi:EthD domain-containing protein [Nocardia flavorosea]|uniref:EthD domain-containing protein n=1 Tax=Nocardia flavorosea TaxID=53429 RepID=A0A846YSZ9_9NOCA|nr:EthD domain-containing protein [Nocardia flavorosea]NKY60604.1 EthD domain-containing protein [Nocardia flavorosea]
MQHRIFVVSLRGDIDLAWARQHWEHRHGALFGQTPGLIRYRQDRPLAETTDGFVCSETWFASRAAESAAFGSAYYTETVVPDEKRFLARDTAWAGRVLHAEEPETPEAPFMVLWFGTEAVPERAGGRWSAIEVDRAVPGPGTGTTVRRGRFDDEAAARRAADTSVLALVCRPVVIDIDREQAIDGGSIVPTVGR